MHRFLPIGVALATVVGCSSAARSPDEARRADRQRAEEELAEAAVVLDEMKQIPAEQRQAARCVAVVPALVRAGFVVGGRHGEGVVSCRTNTGWSAPTFITITGGSAGFQ